MIKCLIKSPIILLILLAWSFNVMGQSDTTSYGTIRFDLNVDEALLILNNQFDEARIITNGETIHARVGRKSVKLSIIQDFLFEKQFVLKEDSLVVVTHEFNIQPISRELLQNNFAARYYFNSNVLLISDDKSDLFLGDEKTGTGFQFYNAEIGMQTIRAEFLNEDGSVFSSKSKNFRNSNYSFTIVENYVKPDENKSRMLSLMPGSSQLYKNQTLKSLLIRTGIALSIASLSTYELTYRKNKRDLDNVYDAYQNSTNSSEATNLGDEMDRINSKMEKNATLRNVSLLTAISIYGYNILDGILSKPKYGYREVKPINFYLDTIDYKQISGTLSISF